MLSQRAAIRSNLDIPAALPHEFRKVSVMPDIPRIAADGESYLSAAQRLKYPVFLSWAMATRNDVSRTATTF